MKIKLEKAFRDKWLKALRSGEFEQTTGHLCGYGTEDKGAFCCLGVAQAVAWNMDSELAFETFDELNMVEGDEFLHEHYHYFDLEGYKTSEVPAVLLDDNKRTNTLVNLNDGTVGDLAIARINARLMSFGWEGEWNGTRLNFDQIADIIEAITVAIEEADVREVEPGIVRETELAAV